MFQPTPSQRKCGVYTINDAVSKLTFETAIPAYYSPVVPGCVRSGAVRPIYTGDNTMMYSRVSVSIILDMISSKVPFDIIKEDDLITIVELLEEYRKVNQPYAENPEARRYLNSVNEGLAVLKPMYVKLCQRQIAARRRKAGPIMSLADWISRSGFGDNGGK